MNVYQQGDYDILIYQLSSSFLKTCIIYLK